VGSNGSKRRITLSPFGRNRDIEETPEQALYRTKSMAVGGIDVGVPPAPLPAKFDWGNAVTDGTIIAFLTFFTTLGGVTLVGVNITNTLASAAISAAAQFFLMLAIKRGLRRPAE
jgi:hypothetical protein